MRSTAQTKHRALHSPHQQHGWHATPPPGELTLLAFWATFTASRAVPSASVPGLDIGTVLGWGNLETIALAVGLAFVLGGAFTMVPLFRPGMAWRSSGRDALAADTASAALTESTFEPQTVCTPAASESDATASTNASTTRPAEVLETNPAFIELHRKALAARRQTEIETARTLCGECSTSGKRLRDAESVIAPAQQRHATELSNKTRA